MFTISFWFLQFTILFCGNRFLIDLQLHLIILQFLPYLARQYIPRVPVLSFLVSRFVIRLLFRFIILCVLFIRAIIINKLIIEISIKMHNKNNLINGHHKSSYVLLNERKNGWKIENKI